MHSFEKKTAKNAVFFSKKHFFSFPAGRILLNAPFQMQSFNFFHIFDIVLKCEKNRATVFEMVKLLNSFYFSKNAQIWKLVWTCALKHGIGIAHTSFLPPNRICIQNIIIGLQWWWKVAYVSRPLFTITFRPNWYLWITIPFWEWKWCMKNSVLGGK